MATENGSELDSRVVDGLRGMRPDRWDRWVKAGRKGNEYRKTLRTLVQHKDHIPLYLQFSRYVERLVDACGVSVSEGGNALGISLEHGYDVLDQPTFSTLEAAESLCLDPRYVRIALQLACFEPAEVDALSSEITRDVQNNIPKSFTAKSLDSWYEEVSQILVHLKKVGTHDQKMRSQHVDQVCKEFLKFQYHTWRIL